MPKAESVYDAEGGDRRRKSPHTASYYYYYRGREAAPYSLVRPGEWGEKSHSRGPDYEILLCMYVCMSVCLSVCLFVCGGTAPDGTEPPSYSAVLFYFSAPQATEFEKKPDFLKNRTFSKLNFSKTGLLKNRTLQKPDFTK